MKIHIIHIFVCLSRLDDYFPRCGVVTLAASGRPWQENGLKFPKFFIFLINDGLSHYNRYQFTLVYPWKTNARIIAHLILEYFHTNE